MRLTPFFGCAVALLGCASAQTQDSPEPRASGGVELTRVDTPKGVFVTQLSTATSVIETPVDATIDATWDAVADVYTALGVTVGTLDTRTRIIGNPGVRMRRSLAGVKLSSYFDCGISALGKRNADSYSLSVDMLTQVLPGEKKSSTLRTRVRASAADEGSSERRVTCSSTGALEARIADMVAERLKGG